jgi:hypothetical protein
MSVKMIVTRRVVSRREKTRRRFRHWWKRTTSYGRMAHLMTCGGCVGCTSVLAEIVLYREEDDVVR